MQQIIFIGEKTSGWFAEEVARERGYAFAYIPARGDIRGQVNEILFAAKGNKCEFLIFDLEQYTNSAEEIADEMRSLQAATNAEVLAYVPAFLPESHMCRTLFDRDLKKFIVAGNPTEMKDQLEKNMNGYYEGNQRKEVKNLLQLQEEEQIQLQHFQTIGVCGACHRIGTTTQALQMVQYLNLKGYKACYMQMNSICYPQQGQGGNRSGYVEKVAYWMDTIDRKNEDLGMISYMSVDLFYRQDKITEVLKQGYDYYVYDYGVYTDPDFNKTAFVKEDVKFFVCGAAPTELDDMEEIAKNPFYEDARLIFSFVPEEDQEDLLGLMEQIQISGSEKENAKRCFFAEWTPEPFVFSALKRYEKILPLEEKKEPDTGREKASRRRLFGRKKGEKRHGKI